MTYVIPVTLTLLAFTAGAAGLRFSSRFRRALLFKIGALATAVGLMLLWLLPWWLFSTDRGSLAMPMFIGALFIAVSVLGAGLSAVRWATGGGADDEIDRIVQDLAHLNDVP